jgi:hypothetical protein
MTRIAAPDPNRWPPWTRRDLVRKLRGAGSRGPIAVKSCPASIA